MSKPKLLRIFDETTKDTAYSRLNNPVTVTQSDSTLIVNERISVLDNAMLTFTAPCSCSSVTTITVGGIEYTLVDLLNLRPTGAWVEGAVVSVVLDCDSKKAYVQSPNKVLNLDENGVLYI